MSDLDVKIEELQQIGVARSGDVIVITFNRRIDDSEHHHLLERWKEMFPDLRLAVFDSCAEIVIVRPGEEDS